MRLQLVIGALICALLACQSGAAQSSDVAARGTDVTTRNAAPLSARAGVDARTCEQRTNDTLAKLEQCIALPSLWHHLSQFQLIADANPGSNGHGNRNTGTPGYAASVAYVARLVRRAGYHVTIQRYNYEKSEMSRAPEFSSPGHSYAEVRDWFVARLSGGGTVSAPVEPPPGSRSGCSLRDFSRFTRGNVALIERGTCTFDMQVANAQEAGASAVVLYNMPAALDDSSESSGRPGVYEARLTDPASLPVIGVASYAVGAGLLRDYLAGRAPTVHIGIRMKHRTDIDYNVIADSPFGDPNHVVVIEGHLDAIHGAGMLDNASGSTSILEVALNMAKTRTRNQLRYIWFGGEELGLLGSHYYTRNLRPAELHRIVFDVDADVTATPNYDILVADPGTATNVKRFPPNVVPESKIGNAYFAEFFKTGGVESRPARFGNDGTDSNAFSLVGVPNTGILTQQDCCKHPWELQIWGGFLGNYEGDIPSRNGGCVDYPLRWCDNLSNNDPFVLELVSKSVAYVTFKLANHPGLP